MVPEAEDLTSKIGLRLRKARHAEKLSLSALGDRTGGALSKPGERGLDGFPGFAPLFARVDQRLAQGREHAQGLFDLLGIGLQGVGVSTRAQSKHTSGANDLWIAAHALASGLVLVSNNLREFGRVSGLQTENWAH